MLPLNYDTPVIDELGKVHPLNEYAGGGGGDDISDAIPIFTSDDTIQNPTEKVSMPLFQSGNAFKDLLCWISKAMQNIRYLLKFTEDISNDLNTTIEQVEDINTNLVKEWTDISVARAGEYYWYNNLIWKALVDTANTPAEGSEWHNVNVMDEVSTLNSNMTNLENYSTDEIAIGKWIDGDIIYKRAFTGTVGSDGILNLNLGFSAKKIIDVKGFVKVADNNIQPFGFVTSGQWTSAFLFNSNIIGIRCDTEKAGKPFEIVVEYTR